MRFNRVASVLLASCLAAPAALAGQPEQLASLAAAAEGEDGCYFGECPEPGATPPTLPPVEQPQTWNEPAPPNQTPWPQQQEMTSLCQTPQFWCQMWEFGPVGADCWCADWYGNIHTGWTIPQ
jgi:hypothetical protein